MMCAKQWIFDLMAREFFVITTMAVSFFLATKV
jgi:hypothetical protein